MIVCYSLSSAKVDTVAVTPEAPCNFSWVDLSQALPGINGTGSLLQEAAKGSYRARTARK